MPTTRDLERENQTSRIDGRGMLTILAGAAILVGGIALSLAFPFPGVIVVFAGLGVIALPFGAAQRRFTRKWAANRGLVVATEYLATFEGLFPEVTRQVLPVLEHNHCTWTTFTDTVGHLNGVPARIGRLRVSRGSGKSKETLFIGGYVAMTLPKEVGSRYAGLSVRVRHVENTDDNHIDRFDHLEKVQLESIELDAVIDVYSVHDADPIAVRELLGPQLIVHLLEHPTSWDQSDRCLLVLDAEQAGRSSKDRDSLCYRAAHLYYAYSRESR